LVEAQSGTAVGGVARDLVGQWLPRAAVPLALAAILGASAVGRSLAVAGSGAAVLGTVYLWACRPLFADLPLPAQLRAWAQRLRLLPRPAVAERVA
jgi:hypothetical protein